MKVKKIVLSIILMAVAIMLVINIDAFAADGRWKLGAEKVREGITTRNDDEEDTTRYSYQMTTDGTSKPVLKIVDKTTGRADFSNAIYCLKAGQGFGSDRETINDVIYDTYFDMIDEKTEVNEILDLTDANYNSVLWLLDNIYLPKQTPIEDRQQERDYLLNEAFADKFSDVNSEFYGWNTNNLHLTDDDIEVVQQWALWHFTNKDATNHSTFSTDILPNILVSETGTGRHDSLSDKGPVLEGIADGDVLEGFMRQQEAETLYEYLITEASRNSDYLKYPTRITLNKRLTVTAKQETVLNASYTIVGPFEIQKRGDTPYTFNGTIVDKNNRPLTYTICDINGYAIPDVRTLSEAVGEGRFYIKIEKSNLVSNNIEDIKLKIDYTTNDTTATFWTVDGSTVDQPVVVIEREPKTVENEISVHIPEFDLALRKYIVSVTRNGVNVPASELTGRTPNIDKTNLKTKTNRKTDTTAEYKHRKDPVSVETGDIVRYAITIYNEGEVAGRATKIVDYLPEGLEFNSAISTDYNFEVSANKRQIIITPKNSTNLNAYNGTTLDSKTIEFTCVVTKREEKGSGKDTVLTNIAEITECYDLNNVKMYLKDDDRDSIPNNLVRPTDANLPDYKGNNSNKTDLTDRNYHYKGKEDDDDFEKLKVTTPEFDLALRKFITHINGGEVESRKPVVDTTPLKNGETTAIYKHQKNPLIVKAGDKIVYTIRVYNEGDIDGYATVIEDYLPEELEIVPKSESTINTTYGWTGTGRTVTTQYLKDTLIHAYDGGDTLDYEDIQIECRVKETENLKKVLTNIAQINAAKDINGNPIKDPDDDRDSIPNNLVRPTDANLPDYKGNNSNKTDLTDKNYHYEGQEDDDDFEKLKVTTPEFDLALRKFITHINGVEVESREPVVDTTPLKNGETTAIYKHQKNPLIVRAGDKIAYTIRVYNEGDIDGYATVIEDYLPEELEIVPKSESTINTTYGWTGTGRTVTTQYLKDTLIHAYDGGDTLDYEDIQIECRVKESEDLGKVLTNIAQINAAKDINGNPIKDPGDDRDSTPMNRLPISDTNLPPYKGKDSNKSDLTDKNYHYEGQEDDDDFEKLKIYQPEYDLALRKFITQVGDEEITTRVPEVDVTPLTNGSNKTDAIYTHPKDPVLVKNGDIVVYTIRVYNEGKFDGYAEEIKDNIPSGLAFVVDNPINIEYRWKLSDDTKQVSTDYLSKERDTDNVIKAFDSETMNTLDYKDVKIAFQVVEPNTSTRILKNIAEIKQDDGKDIDSTPDNDIPDEDDIDVEYVKLRYFDLALRKFITKVESKTGENLPIETDETKDVSREPKVEIGEDGKIKYVHPKDPVIVANSDIVIYTLRVYNEGTVDGFAEEIKDDIPVGLELVPEHEINVQYGWKMYDEEGNVTDDVKKAKTIRTTYLSEANSEDNKIGAFNRDTMTTPAYKDVKVAFKVVEKNVGEDRIVINTAEISKDSDDDIDSTPDNDKPDEDDIDKEYIKLKYFDLSLLKWVSKVTVTDKGETTVKETGFNGLENPEPVVKLEVKPNQMKSIVIKYEYGIKITNEGEIAGYAKEVADYIPEGLEFIPEDNPLWTLKEDGKIVTTQLENTLLQPGESATIHVVFKWINGEDNFGTKVNWAEISKDDNDKDAEDIDSTPDNKVPDEDDIDKALVVLNPKTGIVTMFIVLPTIVIAILGAGIILIKKYVL